MQMNTTSGMQDEAGLPVSLRLARRITAFRPAHITPRALAVSRTAFIDTIGVALAGAAEPCVRLMRGVPGVAAAAGPCLVLGTNRRTSALDAALLNGTASHALDYDDFSQPMGGHQSVPLCTPLLALAEALGAVTGLELIAAYIIGVETEIRLARAVNFHHYDKGWHPTSTMGIFGTAAAASWLLGLDEQRTAVALSISASMSAGLKANFGTMAKPLHVGQCCRNGLFAAMLAEQGFSANVFVIEHKLGFFNAFNGPGNYDANLVFENWGAPLEIESPAMGLKQFPCCASTHPAISMALELVRRDGVRSQDIVDVHIQPHGRRLVHTNNPDPQTPLNAKFSVQYVVARAFLDGAVRLEHFEGDAIHDVRVRDLLAMTRASPHPDMHDDSPKQFGAEVTVTLSNGNVLSRRVDDLVGRGADNPLSGAELREKFADCCKRTISASQVESLYRRLESFEAVDDVGVLTGMMMPGTEYP